MVALSKKIGHGIYSLSEAAFYARIRTQTLGRWLFGSEQGEAVLYPEFHDDDKTVSFLDFVQTLAVRAITTSPVSQRVSIQKIREAVNTAQELFGIEYPLAMQHRLYLMGNNLLIKRPDDVLEQVTGRNKKATYFKEIAEVYMSKLEFAGAKGLANIFKPWGQGKNLIVMDPKIRFGEPMFPANGFTVATLCKAVETEGSVENAAKCYEVDKTTILTAIEYYDHLRQA